MKPFRCFVAYFVFASLVVTGCSDDTSVVREIQSRRQQRLQSESKQDHIGDAFRLLSELVELNREKAERQIVYHLNQWRLEQGDNIDSSDVTTLIKTIDDVLTTDAIEQRIKKERFVASDVNHLRGCYLYQQIVQWVDSELNDDDLLKDWLAQKDAELDDEQSRKLRTACRLFDWTVRNVAFEPLELKTPAPPSPNMPFGLVINGAGYRQSDYETLTRGTGDALQRSGVFTQLCRQASIPAAVLATQSTQTGELTPWCVGILIGDEVYLFEPDLGIFVPGPKMVGIATLTQARRDAAVTRRLGVPGFDEFTYPIGKDNIQQCIALLNVLPEAISPRMKQLQSGLTGERRMTTFADVDAEAKSWDSATGIAGVRIWKVPLLAEYYSQAMEKQAELDPMFAVWYYTKWAIMEGDDTTSRQLAKARWQHLHGQFADVENENIKGARTLYMAQRAPEFEIKDLAIDVDLQKKYFRRELGLTAEQYRQQVAQVQVMMRMGKRTASYWLSLVQFDDGRIETASNWLRQRVLDESQRSFWEAAARYNLARAAEKLGDPEQAIELYKTSGDPQEHGNRIRARLVARMSGDSSDDDSEDEKTDE
ncbi:MAG: tetratricopeptide repeat protein [Pirellulaceae bacterium]|nr:tetratricopeptide repeat protein [Pirellulaceae bacterium]